MTTALVVDDEPQMTAIVAFALETQGFTVYTAHDGATALNVLRTREVDLVVLDVLMPALDGLTLCERIRARSDVPIMLLTALAQHEDVIAGLERGADDYVTKPFHPREVALRAQALVRRHRRGGGDDLLRAGDLVVDRATHTVTVSGRRLELPYTEFKLLAHLMARPGRPQSWQDLLRAVWGTSDLMGGRDVVKSTVYRLRSRLAALDAAGYVQTVRGVGYLMPDDLREPDDEPR
ncbi:response regulator transcription factor [Nonomuraea gerenzanensis]|uniref:Two-component system response regulator n=1 Tax=Nonomuraea gerenzanensis TaxID=93944 RepID=A0A1M4EMC2_9ACTN|nr:response regulator transcription factor [Nonomuraea gerenzanensis]UBU11503.1 response regulator transcription factor [Nonomuraea gerenzanensis]SBO99991.1 Two-component system response regulator [Nonomuraea gerenzanensis]